MLTRGLLRFKIQDGQVVPFFLRPTPAIRELAEGLVAEWRDLVGRPRREVEEATEPLIHGSKSAMVARGLVRVLERRCVFADPASVVELRTRVCQASARLLDTPAPSPAAHRTAVARELGLDPATLGDAIYADLPREARLESVPALAANTLIDAYNLGLAQGLLLFTGELDLVVHDADAGLRRRLLKALRFHRLLAAVTEEDDCLRLQVSGPLAVLDRRGGYGLQFANFLPHVCTARDWTLTAHLSLPDRREGDLRLDHAAGLRAQSQFTAYVPEELATLGAQLAKRVPDWRIDDEAPILRAADGELVVADLRLRTPVGDWCVECFHRWHARPLERRLAQRQAGELPRLIIAAARDLLKLKEHAPLAAQVEAAPWAFAFSGFPTVQGLRTCITALSEGDAG